MRVIVAPGQGSQKPGFLSPWLDDPDVRATLETWSETVNLDLVAHGTVSDAETIRDTKVAQPLIVAAGLIAGRALQRRLGDEDLHYAGHSVGEFTAAALAGVLSDDEALNLVAIRGAAMAEAAAAVPTGMSAVIGANLESLRAPLAEYGLAAANVNSSAQVVAAGKLDALAALQESPPEGTRIIALDVAGAFHTSYMEPAQQALRDAVASASSLAPTAVLYSNQDGQVITDGGEYLDLLVSQMTSPVRWDRCMEAFQTAGVTEIIELMPAGALVGLAKRALPGVVTRRLDLPGQLEELSE